MNLGAGEAQRLLERHESYLALKRCGALFLTGPTRTNVMDVAVIMIEKPNETRRTEAYGRSGKDNRAARAKDGVR